MELFRLNILIVWLNPSYLPGLLRYQDRTEETAKLPKYSNFNSQQRDSFCLPSFSWMVPWSSPIWTKQPLPIVLSPIVLYNENNWNSFLFCPFVSVVFNFPLSTTPTSSAQPQGTLTLFYGMKCCLILKLKIMTSAEVIKLNCCSLGLWHQSLGSPEISCIQSWLRWGYIELVFLLLLQLLFLNSLLPSTSPLCIPPLPLLLSSSFLSPPHPTPHFPPPPPLSFSFFGFLYQSPVLGCSTYDNGSSLLWDVTSSVSTEKESPSPHQHFNAKNLRLGQTCVHATSAAGGAVTGRRGSGGFPGGRDAVQMETTCVCHQCLPRAFSKKWREAAHPW